MFTKLCQQNDHKNIQAMKAALWELRSLVGDRREQIGGLSEISLRRTLLFVPYGSTNNFILSRLDTQMSSLDVLLLEEDQSGDKFDRIDDYEST